MGENSKIEWCDHSANLWWGCTAIAPGCQNCYAETWSARWENDIWGDDKPRKEIASVWKNLAKLQRQAKASKKKETVFMHSMSDLFEKPMPLIDQKGNQLSYDTGHLRSNLFGLIDVGEYPNLIFLFLTKRPSYINKMIPPHWKDKAPENVMFGASISDQGTAKTMIKQLMKVNGKTFLSIEPQLAHVDITNKGVDNAYSVPTRFMDGKGIEWTDPGDNFIGVNWIIQGGESGHNRRPFDLQWAYDMREQCKAANVPYFFKQVDKVIPIPDDLQTKEYPPFFEKG